MCDYAFVIMAYVAVSVLRDLRKRPTAVGLSSARLITEVRLIAALMQSYSGVKGSKALIYGRALNTICESFDRPREEMESATARTGELSPTSTQTSTINPQSDVHGLGMATPASMSQGKVYSRSSEPLQTETNAQGAQTESTRYEVATTSATTSASAMYYENVDPQAGLVYMNGYDYMDVFNGLVGMNHVLPSGEYLYHPADPRFAFS